MMNLVSHNQRMLSIGLKSIGPCIYILMGEGISNIMIIGVSFGE